MATNNPRSLKDAQVILTDSDGTNELELTLENGDLSYTLPDTHEHVPDRGAPGSLIDGQFEAVSFSMTVQVKELTGSAGVQDVVTCTASGWDFSTMDTSSGDYTALTLGTGDTIASASVNVFQMRVTLTDPGDDSSETVYFPNCTGSVQFNEGMPSNFTINGVSYVTASAFMSNIATSA
jgi:hypothetical protein